MTTKTETTPSAAVLEILEETLGPPPKEALDLVAAFDRKRWTWPAMKTALDDFAEDDCLDTLGDCSRETFEYRLIRIKPSTFVRIGCANHAELRILEAQLMAAGLSIPALLAERLAI